MSTEGSILDDPQYPQNWDDYVGQPKAKRQLRLMAASAKARRTRMPHVLLACGEGGIGKTALAGLCAREMGTNVVVISGQTSVDKMRKLFARMSDGDIIVYDEIHQAVKGGAAKSEWMLHYLQDGVLMGPMGAMQCPQVTIIGATTESAKLPETVVSRFVLPELTGYSDDEAAEIALQAARAKLSSCGLPLPSWDVCLRIAAAGNNNPRAMGQVLSTLRDIALIDGYDESGEYDIASTLEMMGLTADGLNRCARRYLIALHEQFEGAAGAAALAGVLQEPGGLGPTERILQNKGLIVLTKQGRTLDNAGIRRAQELMRDSRYGLAS